MNGPGDDGDDDLQAETTHEQGMSELLRFDGLPSDFLALHDKFIAHADATMRDELAQRFERPAVAKFRAMEKATNPSRKAGLRASLVVALGDCATEYDRQLKRKGL